MAELGCVKTKDFEMDYCKFGHGDKMFVILPGLSVQSVMGAADAIEGSYNTKADEYTTYVFDRIKNQNAGVCYDAGHCHCHFDDRYWKHWC